MSLIHLFSLLFFVNSSIAKFESPFSGILDQWKSKFNKTYSKEVETKRSIAFVGNYIRVSEHNNLYWKGASSFQMELNEFADLKFHEFEHNWTGALFFRPHIHRAAIGPRIPDLNNSLPDTFSWLDRAPMSRVKSQDGCAASWAFSVVGAVESLIRRMSGREVNLSEEELINCVPYNSGGVCNKGEVAQGFDYIRKKGLLTEEQFPFGSDRSTPHGIHCRRSWDTIERSMAAPITAWKIVPPDDEQLKLALVHMGPISVHIKATRALQLYKSGIFQHGDCFHENATTINHALLLVGYGSDEKWGDYWVLKNSWGHRWGEKGYMKLTAKPENDCGITSLPTYPILSWYQYMMTPFGKFLGSTDNKQYDFPRMKPYEHPFKLNSGR